MNTKKEHATQKDRDMYNPENVPTIDESLRRDVLNGKITLYEAAVELHVSGWKPYIDVEWAKRRLEL